MANTYITPQMIAREALVQLENAILLPRMSYRDYEADIKSKKVGSSVRIRRPVQVMAQDGTIAKVQDTDEAYMNLVLNRRKHVAMVHTQDDLHLSIDRFSERYIKPAVITLVNTIETDGFATAYRRAYHAAGTPGTTPNSYTAVAAALTLLDNQAVPKDNNRFLFMDNAMKHGMAASIPGLASMDTSKAKDAYERSRIGVIGGYECFDDLNIARHTNGAWGGTPLVNGAAQNVTYATATANGNWQQTLIADGFSNSAQLREGDSFTIAGVNAVNPLTKQDLGYLQRFTLRADVVTHAAGGNTTLTISPPIITTGGQQTVSAAPADNAALTIFGAANTTYPQNIVMHRNAVLFAMGGLSDITGEFRKENANQYTEMSDGLAITYSQGFDVNNFEWTQRLDVLYGWEADARLLARLFG